MTTDNPYAVTPTTQSQKEKKEEEEETVTLYLLTTNQPDMATRLFQ